jgi:hypothetical protein
MGNVIMASRTSPFDWQEADFTSYAAREQVNTIIPMVLARIGNWDDLHRFASDTAWFMWYLNLTGPVEYQRLDGLFEALRPTSDWWPLSCPADPAPGRS